MKTNVAKRGYTPGSLRPIGTARTVLLRMALDEERAERIRELKDNRPDLTWRRIADAVGVSERAAVNWQKTGGIDYENVPKLAELFGVTVDYIWRGPNEGETPDLLESVARAEQLDDVVDRFNGRVDDVEERLDRIEKVLEHIRVENEGQLAQQTGMLKDIRSILGAENAFDALREFAEAVAPDEPDVADAPPPARKPAPRRSRQAG